MCRYREETVREIHSHLVRIDFMFYCVFFLWFYIAQWLQRFMEKRTIYGNLQTVCRFGFQRTGEGD